MGRNHLWAYDFVFDACAKGQQLKCLTVIDEYTRECMAIDVAGSIRSGRVIEVLSRLIRLHDFAAPGGLGGVFQAINQGPARRLPVPRDQGRAIATQWKPS